MTRLPIYQIDAFTDRAFHGNPAAVVPLAWAVDAWARPRLSPAARRRVDNARQAELAKV